MIPPHISAGPRHYAFRQIAAGAAVAGAIILVAYRLGAGGIAETTSNKVFDSYQRILPASRAPGHTVIVDIDDESLRRIGQWPWPRDQIARLVTGLRGARSIGIDILLTEPDRLSPAAWVSSRPELPPEVRAALLALPDNDAVLAAALAPLPCVLAAGVRTMPPNGPGSRPIAVAADLNPIVLAGEPVWPALYRSRAIVPPLPRLARAARGIGLDIGQADSDGVLRRVPVVSAIDETVLPSFALEVLRGAERVDQIEIQPSWLGIASLRVGEQVVWSDLRGEIRPRYADPSDTPRFAAWRVLAGDVDPALLRGRVVLVGVSATAIGESFSTPLGQFVPAIGAQAQVVESLLAGDTLLRPLYAPPVELLFAAMLGLGSTALFGRIGDRAFWVTQAVAAALLVGGGFVLFITMGLLLDWTVPLAFLVAGDITLIVARASRDRLERRQWVADFRAAAEREELSRREALLRDSAERAGETLSIALDAARMGVWDVDLRTGASRRSVRHDDIFGCDPAMPWDREAILAQVVPEEREAVAHRFYLAYETGELHAVCRIARPDGQRATIVIDGRISRDADGTPTRMSGVVTDITESQRLEERLHQAQKLRSIGMMAGGVAHNFNNLLTVVIGNLELARQQVDPAAGLRRLLDAALRAAEAGSGVTRQLLAYARRQSLRPELVDTEIALREFASLLRASLRDNIILAIEPPDHLWPLRIDRTELQLALLNLALNAQDAMKSGGRIVMRAENRRMDDDALGLSGAYVVIAVEDTGVGIPPDILPHVFEPFLTTKAVGEGTGLGLSQVHGFAHQSGGAVDVTSAPGAGTTVRLFLPAVVDAPPAGPPRSGDQAEAPVPTPSPPMVLVVEDNIEIAKMLESALPPRGYNVRVADSARAALSLIDDAPIDLVFADVMMPGGMSGLELAEHLRTLHPAIPVLLTTGYNEALAQEHPGGFHFIQKPYDVASLARRIATLLAAKSAQ